MLSIFSAANLFSYNPVSKTIGPTTPLSGPIEWTGASSAYSYNYTLYAISNYEGKARIFEVQEHIARVLYTGISFPFEIYASTYLNGSLMIATKDKIYAVQPDSGRITNTYNLDGDYTNISGATHINRTVYIASGREVVNLNGFPTSNFVIERDRFRFTRNDQTVSSLAAYSGELYAALDNNIYRIQRNLLSGDLEPDRSSIAIIYSGMVTAMCQHTPSTRLESA